MNRWSHLLGGSAGVLFLIAVAEAQPGRVTEELPLPPAPTVFQVPETDPSGPIARELAQWVQRRPPFRAQHGGTWRNDPENVWSIRPETACHADLTANGITFEPWRRRPLVPAPVRVLPPRVHDVNFHMPGPAVPLYVACETALRLAVIADVVKRYRVTDVYISSAMRADPPTSFHSVGMGIDIRQFQHPDGMLNVERHFLMDRSMPTCERPPPGDWRARTLLAIACDLYESRRFSTVLTPNYNAGHRNHYHVDIRPDDPRQFIR